MPIQSARKWSFTSFETFPTWLLAGVLFLAPFLAFLPAIGAGYIWDDDQLLTSNSYIQSPKGLAVVWFDPTVKGRFYPDYYPLTYTSFAVEYQLWGLKHPLGFHLVNIFLQAINALLVWRVLKLLKIPGAWLAALLFAVHPMNVESVAWISQRKNLLSGLFYLSSAFCFFKYIPHLLVGEASYEMPVEKDADKAPDRNIFWYLLSLFFFVCALFSKPLTMTLAAALLVVIWWKRGRLNMRDFLLVLPYFLLALPMAALTMWLQHVHCAPFARELVFSLPERLIIVGGAIWFYVGKMLFPWPLSFAYSQWTIQATAVLQYLPVLGAVVGLAILWPTHRRPNRAPFAAALFFLVTLSPALGLFQVFWHRYYFVADHIIYLAMISPLALLMAWATEWIESTPTSSPGATSNKRWNWRPWTIPTLALIFAGISFQYSIVFQNQLTLWGDVIKKDPHSAAGYNCFGAVLASYEKDTEAMLFFQKALELRPGFFEAHLSLGMTLGRLGKNDEAFKEFTAALELVPTSHDANLIMGGFLAQKGSVHEAIPFLEQAVASQPSSAAAQAMLGKVYMHKLVNQRMDAKKHLKIALELGSTDPVVPVALKELSEGPASSTQPAWGTGKR